MNEKSKAPRLSDPDRLPRDQVRSYHVEQWQPPNWRGLGSYRDLQAAIAFALDVGGKTRITELPGGMVVWESK